MLNKALYDKLRMFLLIASAALPLSAAQSAFAQANLSNIVVSIDEADIRLSDLLVRITEKTGVSFSYNPRRISAQRLVTYRAANKKLEEVLGEMCDAYGLNFSFVENQVVLKPRSEKPAARTPTISGTVKDARSGEALIGASIYLPAVQTGTTTNAFGFYSLTVPEGNYEVRFSFIGYEEVHRTVALNSSVREDIALTERAPLLEEVVVTSIPGGPGEDVTSKLNIRTTTVQERAEIFGEADVVKSLEAVPGVKFHSDGSTFYYVRGGHRDQNVVFIDDAPIYNPSHLLGVFSTIIPDAVNDITLYKGDMPAAFGGRLSSVLDVRTRKGNDQHFSAWGNLGLISTKLGIEGPFKRNASSYLFSARVSSLQWFLKSVDDDVSDFGFHDFTGKMNFRLNENNRVFFSFYSGADNYFASNAGISWSNNAATLQWNHLFGDRLFLNTTLAGGGYDYFLHADVRNQLKWNSHISNFNLKTDFSYFIRPGNELSFGGGLNGYTFNPGNFQFGNNASPFPVVSVRNSLELVLYGNHQVRLNDKLGVNYGVRFTSWSNAGEAFEFLFSESGNPTDTLFFRKGEGYNRFLNAEPRVTLTYFMGEQSSLKAGYSRNVQNIHLISNSVSPFTSLDVWLPSSFNIKPQTARQLTFGYYHTHPLNRYTLSAEAFWKRMFNQIDYSSHAQVILNPTFENGLRFGNARSYGLEFLLKKDEGRLKGWLGYTWSRAKRKFADINEGREYSAFYDRPHQFNVVASYDISRRWQLGANFNYSNGSPYTAPVSFYQYNGEEVPLYGEKNNARLPDYHRLDISATCRLNRNPQSRYKHNISFSIYNFYGRRNPLFVNFNKVEDADGSFSAPGNLTGVTRVTSQFSLYGFVPSFSYSFRWL